MILCCLLPVSAASSAGRLQDGYARALYEPSTHDYRFGSDLAQAEERDQPPNLGPYRIHFLYGGDELTDDAVKAIRAIVPLAKSDRVQSITVTGHADRVGHRWRNLRLSRRRALAVAAQLRAEGIGGDKLLIRWRGETRLPFPTEDGMPEPANRCVEIVINREGERDV
ncbi:OmpA family protein [Sphingomonas kaistensis]|uniref:OmpA family protein n=1 Tax=Sphingomonas kaistensis TaxID=298708 RepID=UPI003CC86E41